MAKRLKYPYTETDGTLHASPRVVVYIDIEGVRADLETEEWCEDYDVGDGREVRRTYLGSWQGLSPSGKTYMPWACSNVDECPVCFGSCTITSPLKRRLRKKYRNKALKLRKHLLRYYGTYRGGKWEWPPHLCKRLFHWDELARERPPCPRCGGVGSAEAHDDEVFTEALDTLLENEVDLYIEQSDGGIFVTQYRGAAEEEEVADV